MQLKDWRVTLHAITISLFISIPLIQLLLFVVGRGIPVALMTSNNKSEPVGITRIPAVDIALMFAGGEGHNYQQPYVYGVDPLAEDVNLQADRHQQFRVQFNIEEIYNHVVAGHRQTFLSAIMFWQDVTTRLAPAS